MGFLLGCLLVSFLFKGKSCRFPSTLKLEELRLQRLEYSPLARCTMKCQEIDEEEINEFLKNGAINYKQSDVHAKPYPFYAVEGITKKGQEIRMVFSDNDTITRIVSSIKLNNQKHTCNCKD